MFKKSSQLGPIAFKKWLEQSLLEGNHGERLPSYRTLAKEFEISLPTVQKHMQAPIMSGQIVSTPGQGCRIHKASETDQEQIIVLENPKTSADILQSVFHALILNGRIRIGECFPPIKELVAKYKVSPNTVIAALKGLQAQGMLSHAGNLYRVGREHGARAKPIEKIVRCYFADGVTKDEQGIKSELWKNVIEHLEYELHRQACVLEMTPLSNLKTDITNWRKEGRAPSGVIVMGWTVKYSEDIYPSLLKLARTSPEIMPQVILDRKQSEDFPTLRSRKITMLHSGSVTTSVCRSLAEWIDIQGATNIHVFHNSQSNHFTQFRDAFGIHMALLERGLRGLPFKVHILLGNKSDTPQTFLASPFKIWKEYLNDRYAEFGETFTDAFISNHTRFYHSKESWYKAAKTVSLSIFQSGNFACEFFEWYKGKATKIISLEDSPDVQRNRISICVPDWRNTACQMTYALLGSKAYDRSIRGFMRISASVIQRQAKQG